MTISNIKGKKVYFIFQKVEENYNNIKRYLKRERYKPVKRVNDSNLRRDSGERKWISINK